MPNAQSPAPPTVSVIMATYNGARYIRQSIDSLLAQTWRDFELIVVDDCSTDATLAILESVDDPRLRVLRNAGNMGVVRSRNRCFAEARGRLVAMLDHDDLSKPTRLQKQVEYLDAHPDTALVGTAAHNFDRGMLTPTKQPAHTTPTLIRWLLHVANPLICSSVMFRAASARQLEPFMREDYKYADDYDLYHRLLPSGTIARLDEPLTIYRLHASNTFRVHETTMLGNAEKVLAPALTKWFGADAGEAARLVVRYLSAGQAVADSETLARLQRYFQHLNTCFIDEFSPSKTDTAAIQAYADSLWRLCVQRSTLKGLTALQTLGSGSRLSPGDTMRFAVRQLPLEGRARRLARSLLHREDAAPDPTPGRLFGQSYDPIKVDPGLPPTMFVVIDTEAEFNWHSPFARNQVNVSGLDEVERGQAVFDRYGLRPIYVVDHPVASQERSAGRLRAILERGGCAIGAHLHPWTTPPFEEQLSSRNSFPGNLPPALEEEKLQHLLSVIGKQFGLSPQFYKAGRYGLGPASAEIIARHGIKVDLSVLAGANLQRIGGPDFSGMGPGPYRIGPDLITVPMTRGHVGLLPPLHRVSEAMRDVPGLRWMPTQAVLSRLNLADTITLTPEGVTTEEQLRLVNAMLKQGNRLLVLHYHSPSLSAGHTPYARNQAEADALVRRIEEVCEVFFEEMGGMPGQPDQLLRMADQVS